MWKKVIKSHGLVKKKQQKVTKSHKLVKKWQISEEKKQTSEKKVTNYCKKDTT